MGLAGWMVCMWVVVVCMCERRVGVGETEIGGGETEREGGEEECMCPRVYRPAHMYIQCSQILFMMTS